jgi:anaerobic selenocysteine-containing dehydrogenase
MKYIFLLAIAALVALVAAVPLSDKSYTSLSDCGLDCSKKHGKVYKTVAKIGQACKDKACILAREAEHALDSDYRLEKDMKYTKKDSKY